MRVEDVPSGRVMLETAAGALDVPLSWPSSLYRAVFSDSTAYFAVRAAEPASPILVSIPFPTWEAYNRAGVPGEGLYQAEQPDRATRVTFDRPGGGPQPEGWELGLLRWLGPAGYDVEYCSGLDLHLDLLRRYRLLVINGHDEYWSKEMRDAVEEFVRTGGNLAIFSGNTCWWQVRFEDDLRTMVCHRDAVTDPLSTTDPARTTVEWSSAPVNRPESALTGVSYRYGAGCWVDSRVMADEAYTVRFADHWVFEGTGLHDGDTFARGAIGYETDAIPYEEIDGVPHARSAVVLATADLRHWRAYGKGGAATMVIHQPGTGTVFNAATINWGNTLTNPTVARITQNVLNRLSTPTPPNHWETIGRAGPITSLTVCDGHLFALEDDVLLSRPVSSQNLPWRPTEPSAPPPPEPPVHVAPVRDAPVRGAPVRDAPVHDASARDTSVRDAPGGGVIALAAPREVLGGPPLGLYGVTAEGVVRYRDSEPSDWRDVGHAPNGTIGIAAVDAALFAIADDGLWHARLGEWKWTRTGSGGGAQCLTAANGRLYALSHDRIITRMPFRTETPWTDLGPAPQATALAAHAGRLIAAVPNGPLLSRPAH